MADTGGGSITAGVVLLFTLGAVLIIVAIRGTENQVFAAVTGQTAPTGSGQSAQAFSDLFTNLITKGAEGAAKSAVGGAIGNAPIAPGLSVNKLKSLV